LSPTSWPAQIGASDRRRFEVGKASRCRPTGPAAKGGSGGLHGLVDHGQQVAVEGVQVDLVPQPGRELVDGAGGVIAAAVEAPVDQLLDPAPQRLEQGDGAQGDGGHREAARPLEQAGGRGQDQHIRQGQQGGDQRVSDGPADQAVQVPSR
jgi:hypothetical protein